MKYWLYPIHPILMWVLFVLVLYAFYSGVQVRRTRMATGEARKTLKFNKISLFLDGKITFLQNFPTVDIDYFIKFTIIYCIFICIFPQPPSYLKNYVDYFMNLLQQALQMKLLLLNHYFPFL